MIEFLSSLNPVITALSGGGVLGFLMGFFTRWYFFRKKAHADLVHSSITDLETSLAKLFEEAVSYVEKIHTKEVDEESYTEIRRQLMIARLQHARKLVDNLRRLDNTQYPLPETTWIEFRQASDHLFDKPKEGCSLGHLAATIADLSSKYVKITH